MGTTRFASNEMARLAYEVAGPEDGPAIVLAHATLLDRTSFAAAREALAAAGWRVIAPDARGHGASAMIKGRTLAMNDLANDLFVVLEAEGFGVADAPPVTIAGHGQGAIAALAFARWRPDRVAALTLIEPDAPAVLDGAQDPEIIAARDAAIAANQAAADASYKELPDRAANLYLDRRWGPGWRNTLPKPRLAAIRRHAPALAGTLDALAAYRITPDAVAALPMPVEVIISDRTPVAERAIAETLATWLRIRITAIPIDGRDYADLLSVWTSHVLQRQRQSTI